VHPSPHRPAGPLTLGTFTASAGARRYVNDVLDSGRLSYGPYSRRFEQDFADIHDSRFAVLSNSGTSALLLALQALKETRGWREGDEVLVPAVTFVATINVCLHLGLRPVLVDVEPDFYGMDPALAEQAIGPRTRAILPVHLFGLPCAMDPLTEIARAHDLAVVEDSCETMFARYRGRMCGSLGDVGCFSTYVAHLVVTGVGGLCTTDDPELATRMRSLANHGRDGIYISIDDDKVGDESAREEIVSRRFNFEHLGHSFRVTELEAAIGCAALETWPEMIGTRRRHAQRLSERLAAYGDLIQTPGVRPQTDHSFMMYPLVLRREAKHELVQHLERSGIETRDMMPVLPQPVYQGVLDIEPGRYPVAEWIDSSGFYVGCHQDLSVEQIDYLADELCAWLDASRLRRAA
jgi:perosamine synthetase